MKAKKNFTYLVLFSRPVHRRNGETTFGVVVETYSPKQALYMVTRLLKDNLVLERWQSREGEIWLEEHWNARKFVCDTLEPGCQCYQSDGLEYDIYTYFPEDFKETCFFIDFTIAAVPFNLWEYRSVWFTDDGFLLEPTLAHSFEKEAKWEPLTEDPDVPF